MNKKAFTERMVQYRGGRDLICVAHLAKYLEVSERKAAHLVDTLPFIRDGRRRSYQIEDVVERLMEQRELEG